MGWTSYNAKHYKNGKVDRIAEVVDYFEKDNTEDNYYKVLKISAVGSTIYSAVERVEKGERIVFAAVFLTRTNMKDYYNFSYKDMDETCGPCQRDCPASILKLLTPTDSEFANEWRKDCWDNLKKKAEKRKNPDSLANLPIGSLIEMKYWEEGIEYLILKKIKPYGYTKAIWYSKDTGYKYSNRTIEYQGYKVVSKGETLSKA